jgi:hypothetical protein
MSYCYHIISGHIISYHITSFCIILYYIILHHIIFYYYHIIFISLNRDVEILVKSNEKELLKELKSWKTKKIYSEEKINDLYMRGLVIPLPEKVSEKVSEFFEDDDNVINDFNTNNNNDVDNSNYNNYSPSYDSNSMPTYSNQKFTTDTTTTSSSSMPPLPPKGLLKVPTLPSPMTRSGVASYINIGTSR